MYGSQLSAGETHEEIKLVPGVSDSRKRDVPETQTDTSPKPTPPVSSNSMMSSKSHMPKMSGMLIASKKSRNSENSESGTVQ